MECSYTLQAVVGNPVTRKKKGITMYAVQEIRVQNNLLLFLETIARCVV
jgi:hypothetical protein